MFSKRRYNSFSSFFFINLISCRIIAQSIQIVIQDLENACEPALTAMTKLSWQTIETVGDQSLYITTMINHLKTNVPIIRNHLGSSRKSFIQFCTNFVR